MAARKRKYKIKVKRNSKRSRDPQDKKYCLTTGQLCNIVDAAEKKKNACPKARLFIKELKAEMREIKLKNKEGSQ